MKREKKKTLFDKFLISVTVLIIFSSQSAFSQSQEVTLSTVKTPEEIARWISSEFTYSVEFPDKWQSPEETIRLKRGDCEDFAILASEALKRQGIDNDIVIVKFEGLDTSHAICIWKDSRGIYSFISNKKLMKTGETDIRGAIERYYPDWRRITFTDPEHRNKRVLRRS